MPTYDYACHRCGTFSLMRPMSQHNSDQACPTCGAPSARIITAVPSFGMMNGAARLAHATNERSAHAPQSSATLERKRHGPGCSCCRPNSGKAAQAGGKKSFPSARPWMISH